MSKYETPILITYGFSCPVHGGHQRSVALAEKPDGRKIIDMNICTDNYPNSPTYVTKLYGDLRLIVNVTKPRATKMEGQE